MLTYTVFTIQYNMIFLNTRTITLTKSNNNEETYYQEIKCIYEYLNTKSILEIDFSQSNF